MNSNRLKTWYALCATVVALALMFSIGINSYTRNNNDKVIKVEVAKAGCNYEDGKVLCTR